MKKVSSDNWAKLCSVYCSQVSKLYNFKDFQLNGIWRTPWRSTVLEMRLNTKKAKSLKIIQCG